MKPDNSNSLSRHCIHTDATLLDAIRAINALDGGEMTLFVTDGDGRVKGSLTDGDIRRGLVDGVGLDSAVNNVMFKGFRAIRPGCDVFSVVAEARAAGVQLLPRLDAGGRIAELINLTQTHALLPIDAVLMAGGLGERLRPLTNDCPKPLLKVGGKAIIDYNIDALLACGVHHIDIAVRYLAERIEEHVADKYPGRGVRCVREQQRLGTFGALSLIDDFENDDVLVMNSDLLTTIDFGAMYEHHRTSGAAATVAVTPYTVSVPFAIMQTEADRVTGMMEKPTYNYFANAGVYIVKRSMLNLLKRGEYMDAPDFLTLLIDSGHKVSHFRIDGTWIDIGSPDDYRYACELMAIHKA